MKAAPNAKYIIVSNPVDVLTYVFTKISGLPENQIIGSGTLLDTARLRYGLSRHFNVALKNIHAYVYGEHGDSSFVPWSGANIASMPIDDYYKEMTARGVELKSWTNRQWKSTYTNQADRLSRRRALHSTQYPSLL